MQTQNVHEMKIACNISYPLPHNNDKKETFSFHNSLKAWKASQLKGLNYGPQIAYAYFVSVYNS